MAYLVLNAAALLLIAGFFGLTRLEAKRGTRLFESARKELDQHAAKFVFVVTHVDWNSFAREQVMKAVHRFGHDIAHRSLLAVRALERLLTQAVRRLRSERTPQMTARESMRPFVKTLADLKGQLEATRPEMPEIL